MIDFASAYPNSRKVVETRTATLTPGGAVRFTRNSRARGDAQRR